MRYTHEALKNSMFHYKERSSLKTIFVQGKSKQNSRKVRWIHRSRYSNRICPTHSAIVKLIKVSCENVTGNEEADVAAGVLSPEMFKMRLQNDKACKVNLHRVIIIKQPDKNGLASKCIIYRIKHTFIVCEI